MKNAKNVKSVVHKPLLRGPDNMAIMDVVRC